MSINTIPLAERMRPQQLHEFVGQAHLVGNNGAIKQFLDKQFCPSIIFWGPPGVGKTTLARLIAFELRYPFFSLSAINAGVKQVREIITKAKKQGKAILFIDEIHRFSKSQQDSLLGAVEAGIITLIGATTENPSFEVNSALLSRCQVYVLNPLNKEDLVLLLDNALRLDAVLKKKNISITPAAYEALIKLSGGDARKLLNLFEMMIAGLSKTKTSSLQISLEAVTQFARNQMLRYDKTGEQHYDIVSAFIKSIRGSDPNAAVYWLARMIEGGEDPKFIARRLLILASEDIGNANPTALVMANNCYDAVHKIGYPECRIILSQVVIYLATSTKSNASYVAINDAQTLVRKTGNLAIPLHLRNAPTQLMKQMEYGTHYQYAHNYEGNFVAQEFMPEAINNTKLYEPGNNSREADMRKRLKQWWQNKYNY